MYFHQVVSGLIEMYQSIDVRVAAYRDDNTWNSAVLVVRFRKDSVDVLKTIQSKLEADYGLIQADDLKISLHALPIEKWKSICENWYKHFICLSDDYAVNFKNSDAMNREMSEPISLSTSNYVDKDWEVYYVSHHHDQEGILTKLQNHNIDAVKLGFPNIHEYLSTLFEIAGGPIADQGLTYMVAPTYSKIRSVLFKDEEIQIKYHGLTTDLDFVLSFQEADKQSGMPRETKSRKKFHYKPGITEHIASESLFSEKIVSYSKEDRFRLHVFKNDVLLGTYFNFVNYCLPIEDAVTSQPLLSSFREFVPIQELRRMLFNTYDIKGSNPKTVFERGIAWLLSLVDFKVIRLEEFEKFGVGPTGVSVDILASHNAIEIILVNVTLGLPDVSDLDREKNFRVEFKKKVSNKEMDVRSMLFTAYPVNQLQTPAQENEVRLIGKTELESILDNLEKGETELARKMIWQHDEVRF